MRTPVISFFALDHGALNPIAPGLRRWIGGLVLILNQFASPLPVFIRPSGLRAFSFPQQVSALADPLFRVSTGLAFRWLL
jgi:hypothetical protein